MEELSTSAIALLTMLQDGYEADSIYLREHFSREFPEADYDKALMELGNAGMYPEPAEIFNKSESTKVRFSRLSPLHLRAY